MTDTNYNVYLLKHSIHNRTYLGITNNLKRRIRQHNCEIKGGAKATTSMKGNGNWIYHLIIPNLTKSKSLSIERILKNKRRQSKGKTPLERRVNLIEQLGYTYNFLEKSCDKNNFLEKSCDKNN